MIAARAARIRALLGNPVVLRAKLRWRAWLAFGPALAWLAAAYRRVWIPHCRIVVVVGSFGKTTTAHALAHALDCRESSLVNKNLLTNVAWHLLRLGRGTTRAVVEVGIGAKGQMKAFARMTRPDVVVVTAIGSEHQETLGPPEEIRREKAIMLEALKPDGLAVLNGDDPNVVWMGSRTRARIVSCGTGPQNQIRASHVALRHPPGMELAVEAGGERLLLTTRLLGRKMVFPLLAAVAVAREEGVPAPELRRRLEALPPFARRMEAIGLPNGAWGILDDRKALPETIAAATEALTELPAKRKWAVMGEIGAPEDDGLDALYRRCGAALGRACDELILTTADPHKQRLLVEAATQAGLAADHIGLHVNDLPSVVSRLRRELGPGDVVLFKGRLHERLSRIVLALGGRDVSCWIPRCDVRTLECPSCPLLTARRAAGTGRG